MYEEHELLDPIFKSFDNTVVLKQFDGQYNYLNCASNGINNFYRKEFIKNNKLYSNIIDDSGNNIIENEFVDDEEYIYEDPRYVSFNEISLIKTYRKKDRDICYKTLPVLYNLKTKKITHVKLEQCSWEKNWIFYKNYIFYRLSPYGIFNRNGEIIKSVSYNFKYWRKKWGNVRLSCNPFIVNDQYYLLFHSRLNYNTSNSSYINGLILMNKDLSLKGYYKNPFNIDIMVNYNISSLMKKLYDWKISINYPTIHCKLHYFTSVITDSNNIYLYGGKDDCQAIKIIIPIKDFLNRIKNKEIIYF